MHRKIKIGETILKKIILAAVTAALGLMLLTSCRLIDKLGFDTYDYMSESVTSTHGTEGELADELGGLVGILITDSPTLETFTDMGGAIKNYRDEVLTYMLETGYSKYPGNTALIEEAEEEYPQYHITQIIPESEFEATMYRVFGGSVKLTHKSSERFEYLDRVGAYISPVMFDKSDLSADITYIGETDKTYRVRFYVAADGERLSDEYFALIIKRDDGTLYIKKLLKSSDVK